MAAGQGSLLKSSRPCTNLIAGGGEAFKILLQSCEILWLFERISEVLACFRLGQGRSALETTVLVSAGNATVGLPWLCHVL